MARLLPFDADADGFLSPDIGYAGGADALCPMRLPASDAEVLVLRDYRTVLLALTDRRFSIAVDDRFATTGSAFRDPADLPTLDPPATTEIRRPLGAVFGERAIAAHEETLARISTELATGLEPTADLVRDYCEPYIARVVSATVGLPLADWPHILELAGKGLGTFEDTAERADRTAAWHALYDYTDELIARKRAELDGLLLAGVLTALERAGLSPETVRHTVATVVVGLPTPTGVLVVTVLELLRRPALVAECRATPDRWGPVVAELMRWRANFSLALPRVAREDVAVGDGRVIRRGQVVVASLHAAAHDPARTARPEEFDVDQEAARNIVFGAGPHLCPGAALGRQWLVAGLRGLFSSVEPQLADGDLGWQRGTLSVPTHIIARLRRSR